MVSWPYESPVHALRLLHCGGAPACCPFDALQQKVTRPRACDRNAADDVGRTGTLTGIGKLSSFIMSGDLGRFYKLAEVCRDRAAQARNSIDGEAWLKLADDWLKLARANEKPRQSLATRRAASD